MGVIATAAAGYPVASRPPAIATASTPAPGSAPDRLATIDAYRGFVMFLMMAEVLHLCRVSENFSGNACWSFLCNQPSHVDWVGCVLHDMIQPSFSFLVGV